LFSLFQSFLFGCCLIANTNEARYLTESKRYTYEFSSKLLRHVLHEFGLWDAPKVLFSHSQGGFVRKIFFVCFCVFILSSDVAVCSQQQRGFEAPVSLRCADRSGHLRLAAAGENNLVFAVFSVSLNNKLQTKASFAACRASHAAIDLFLGASHRVDLPTLCLLALRRRRPLLQPPHLSATQPQRHERSLLCSDPLLCFSRIVCLNQKAGTLLFALPTGRLLWASGWP
jgi:hypothetical protein